MTNEVCGSRGHLLGGYLTGFVAEMAEVSTDRASAWVTTQFVSPAIEGETIRLEFETLADGRNLSQLRVIGTIADRLHSTSLVAAGTKPLDDHERIGSAPVVAGPEDCVVVDLDPGLGSLNRSFEVRSANLDQSQAEAKCFWVRRIDGLLGDTSSLAVVADQFPASMKFLLNRRAYGASLDNTVRYIDRSHSDWLLVEFTLHSLHLGIAHGTAHIWSQAGDHLAVASQTCSVSLD